MAKASLKLPAGTLLTIKLSEEVTMSVEGSAGEIRQALRPAESGDVSTGTGRKRAQRQPAGAEGQGEKVNLAELVKLAKSCKEAEAIESKILNGNSQLDRTLLPLYLVHEHKNNVFGLTSGEISKFLKELDTPMATTDVSKTLSRRAKRYVVGDKLRKRGATVRYKLIRRGVQYVKEVLAGKSSDDKK